MISLYHPGSEKVVMASSSIFSFARRLQESRWTLAGASGTSVSASTEWCPPNLGSPGVPLTRGRSDGSRQDSVTSADAGESPGPARRT